MKTKFCFLILYICSFTEEKYEYGTSSVYSYRLCKRFPFSLVYSELLTIPTEDKFLIKFTEEAAFILFLNRTENIISYLNIYNPEIKFSFFFDCNGIS